MMYNISIHDSSQSLYFNYGFNLDFVFFCFSCEKPASRLLPSFLSFFCFLPWKRCQKRAQEISKRERESKHTKTKQKLKFLHYTTTMRRRFRVVVVVFRTCCWLSSFAAASASAGSAKMKLIEFIIFYAFLHFARRRRRRRRWPQKCKIRSRIFHILLSEEKTLHEIVLLLLLLLFTINLWNAEKLFLWAIFVYVCRERKREKSEKRMRCKWGEKWCNKFRSNYDIWTIKIDRW